MMRGRAPETGQYVSIPRDEDTLFWIPPEWEGDRVPVEIMQRALLNSRLTHYEAARRLNMYRNNTGKPNTSGLMRKLGLTKQLRSSKARGSKKPYYAQTVSLEWAVSAIRAWHLDPVDYGV
jgi:hypothetical protein